MLYAGVMGVMCTRRVDGRDVFAGVTSEIATSLLLLATTTAKAG